MLINVFLFYVFIYYNLNLNVNLHIVAGGYVVVQEKLPNYVVPDLTNFKVCIIPSWNLLTILYFVHLSSYYLFAADLTFIWWIITIHTHDKVDIVPLIPFLNFLTVFSLSYGIFFNFSLASLFCHDNGKNSDLSFSSCYSLIRFHCMEFHRIMCSLLSYKYLFLLMFTCSLKYRL